MDYVLYVADCETTGLDSRLNDVIELSLLKIDKGFLNSGEYDQKTWCLKPTNFDHIEAAALRINGHKLEDIKWETKAGRERYADPNKTIIEIENWVMEDGVPAEQRVLVGQNIGFDREFFEQLWVKCNSKDSFPFGRRVMDTLIIQFFLDWCKGSMAEGYSLNALVKKYGVKNEKAHTAAADTLATKDVFQKQVEFFKSVLSK